MKLDKRKVDLLMAKRCMTQQQLCDAAGVSVTAVAGISKTRTSKTLTIGKIAAALGVEPEDIIE